MNDMLVVLVLGVVTLGVFVLSNIDFSGNKKTSDKKDQLIKAQNVYISTLEDGIKIRDKLIKTLELDILLLERKCGMKE